MKKNKKFKNPLENYLYFWIDMFEFNTSNLKKDFSLYSELVWNLDQDNSNIAYIELFDTIFSYKNINISWFWKWLIFETSIDWFPVPCFALLHWKPQDHLKKWWHSKDKIVLYSSFFVLDSLQKLPFTVLEFIWTLFDYKNALLYRLDACLDVPYTILELSKIFLDMKKPSSAIWTDKKHPEFYQTYYLWEIQNSKNRNSLIRIYDKVLDTWKKHKAFLYPHLQNNNDVRRIELELRPEQAKRFHNYNIMELLENKNDVIGSIFSEYVNKRIPEKYHLEKGSLNIKTFPKRKFDLKQAFLDFWHIPKDYLKRSYWYVKKVVHNTWYNWLFQLLFNSEHTDIFLQKNIKLCVNNILENKPYSLMINSQTIQNDDNTINAYYEVLEEFILFWKNNPYLSWKKINKILKNNVTAIKIKLKKDYLN